MINILDTHMHLVHPQDTHHQLIGSATLIVGLLLWLAHSSASAAAFLTTGRFAHSSSSPRNENLCRCGRRQRPVVFLVDEERKTSSSTAGTSTSISNQQFLETYGRRRSIALQPLPENDCRPQQPTNPGNDDDDDEQPNLHPRVIAEIKSLLIENGITLPVNGAATDIALPASLAERDVDEPTVENVVPEATSELIKDVVSEVDPGNGPGAEIALPPSLDEDYADERKEDVEPNVEDLVSETTSDAVEYASTVVKQEAPENDDAATPTTSMNVDMPVASDDAVVVVDEKVKAPMSDMNVEAPTTTITPDEPVFASTDDRGNAADSMAVSGDAVNVANKAAEQFFADRSAVEIPMEDKSPQKPVPAAINMDDEGLERIRNAFSVETKAAAAQALEKREEPTSEEQKELVLPKEEESIMTAADLEKQEPRWRPVPPKTRPVPPKTQPPMSLLPRKEWDAHVVCAQAFASVEQRPILLFDGACNLCNSWVNFCLDYDVAGGFRFASLQSRVGQAILIRDGRPPDDRSDIILATPQDTYAKTDAVLRVISQLEGLPIPLRFAATFARLILPGWFRDGMYRFVAANRHILGDTDGPVCRLDLDGEYIGRFIEDPELDEETLANKKAEEDACVKIRR